MKTFIAISALMLICYGLFSQETQTIYTYNQIWANHHIVIMDSEYYKRLDEHNRIRFEKELENIHQAYNMMDIGDWERAIYFSKQIRNSSLRCDQRFIQGISYANTNNKGDAKRAYMYSKKYCDPEKNRVLESEFKVNKISTRINFFDKYIWTVFY